jgi:hypothetical protein
MEYTTTGENGPAPKVDGSVVLPSGGQFYPVSRYQAAVDEESKLKGLDRPLGTCDKDQFLPNQQGDMYNSRLLVPRIVNADPGQIQEVSFPKVLLNVGPYECRKEQDTVNMDLSMRMFNNATKQDRYKLKGKV